MEFEKSSRKIFDILPPEKGELRLPKRKEIVERRPFFPFKKGILLIIFILFLAFSLFHFLFQKATISIWPETKEVSFKEKIIVDKNFKDYNFLAKTIPGEFLSKEEIVSQEFSSSGKALKETKATGTIRVYNAYSTDSQVLVATTRFVSAEGKLFRSKERVVIPGGTYEGRELRPGFLDIQVEAAEAGPEYNIGPSTFSIPGFAGTPKYTAFYGKSSDPMKGGFKGETFQVTEKDLEKGEEILKENLENLLESSLKNRISENSILLEGAIKKEKDSPIFSAKAGSETEKFTGQIKGIIKALVFKKQDLEKIAKDFILTKIAQGESLKEDSLKIDFSPETIDFQGGKIILNLEILAKVFSDFDEENLKREVTGKSLSEVRSILEKNLKITKFELKLQPFWLKNLPQDPEKIKIELRD